MITKPEIFWLLIIFASSAIALGYFSKSFLDAFIDWWIGDSEDFNEKQKKN